jgi:two-component system response regulator HydG
MNRIVSFRRSQEVPVEAAAARVLMFSQGLATAQLAAIVRAATLCGARCCRVERIDSIRDDAIRNDDQPCCSVAIVALQSSNEASLATLRKARDACSGVIAIAVEDGTTSIGEKCRAMLAGASCVLDGNGDGFGEALASTLGDLLAKQQQQHDEERRIRNVARAHSIVGESPALLGTVRQLVRISVLSDLPVLITGESGTGKELFAAALHALDPKRCSRQLVAVNCAAINSGVAESQLFGHVRGAFTGANQDHGGWFAAAHGSVLFLDEIGELSLDVQAKILRVLQEREIQSVGASKGSKIDVRVVAATNCDLPQMIAQGRFREDLYHRLNSLNMRIPPLRERGGDLALLVTHFLNELQGQARTVRADPELINALSQLRWTGNVRELRNLVITVLAAKTDSSPLRLRDLPMEVWRELSAGQARAQTENGLPAVVPQPCEADNNRCWNLDKLLAQHERQILTAALREVDNNQSRAAVLLGITPRSVYNKLRKHSLLARRGS